MKILVSDANFLCCSLWSYSDFFCVVTVKYLYTRFLSGRVNYCQGVHVINYIQTYSCVCNRKPSKTVVTGVVPMCSLFVSNTRNTFYLPMSKTPLISNKVFLLSMQSLCNTVIICISPCIQCIFLFSKPVQM